jgi:hypothetical protein
MVNYLKVKDILVQMGLLSENQAIQPESKERQLLYDLWIDISGNQSEQVNIESVRVMLQVITRIIDPKRVNNKLPLNSDEKKDLVHTQYPEIQGSEIADASNVLIPSQDSLVGFLNDQGHLCIRPQEVAKIQAHYSRFYDNRLQFLGKQLENKKNEKAQQIIKQESTFKPKIAKGSEQLAQQRKIKIANQLGIDTQNLEGLNLDTVELLRAQGEFSNMTKLQKAQMLEEERFSKEYTFAPVISTRKPKANKRVMPDRTSVGSINLDGIAKKKQGTDTSLPNPGQT